MATGEHLEPAGDRGHVAREASRHLVRPGWYRASYRTPCRAAARRQSPAPSAAGRPGSPSSHANPRTTPTFLAHLVRQDAPRLEGEAANHGHTPRRERERSTCAREQAADVGGREMVVRELHDRMPAARCGAHNCNERHLRPGLVGDRPTGNLPTACCSRPLLSLPRPDAPPRRASAVTRTVSSSSARATEEASETVRWSQGSEQRRISARCETRRMGRATRSEDASSARRNGSRPRRNRRLRTEDTSWSTSSEAANRSPRHRCLARSPSCPSSASAGASALASTTITVLAERSLPPRRTGPSPRPGRPRGPGLPPPWGRWPPRSAVGAGTPVAIGWLRPPVAGAWHGSRREPS